MQAPLHPIFVHFSIALTSASFAFDLAGAVLGQPSLAAAGWWTLATSSAVTLGTIVTGLVSRVRLAMEEGPARSYLRAHMALGPFFLGLLLSMTAWRALLRERSTSVPWSYSLAMLGLLCVMALQGYVGGELVFRFGAAVHGRYERLPSEPDRDRPGA